MADQQPHPEKIRGTLSLTHKQAFIAFLSTLSVGQMSDIKELIVGDTDRNLVRVEQAQEKGVSEIKQEIRHLRDELVEAQVKAKDQTWDEIARSENRCEDRAKDIIARVGNLEVYAFKTKSRGG